MVTKHPLYPHYTPLIIPKVLLRSGILSEINNSTITLVMLLNIFAEPVTKVSRKRKTYAKAIHYLENELHHTTLQIDEPVRPSHTVPYSIWDTRMGRRTGLCNWI